MNLFDSALEFAIKKHSGMTRKRENVPYILHPLEVATIAGTLTEDTEILAAAVLHDTVEDTDTSIGEIEAFFGLRVAALVASETENKRPEINPEKSWRIRKEESLEKLKQTSDIGVKILWLADKLSNMRSFYREWKHEGSTMWEAFNQKNPTWQAWYYRSVCVLVEDLKDSEAWSEYNRLVETIFEGIHSDT